MTLAPLIASTMTIKVHVAAALVVIVLTPLQFFGFRKGSPAHRAIGYGWMLAMVGVALSSFFITSHFALNFAGFGLIHLFSIVSLITLAYAFFAARLHRVRAHRTALFFLTIGFFVAGAFTFLPSRIIGQVLFGS